MKGGLLFLVIACALALTVQRACGSEVYQDEPQYNAAVDYSFAEVDAEVDADLSLDLEAEMDAEADAEHELEADEEGEADAEADSEAEADVDAAASLLEAESAEPRQTVRFDPKDPYRLYTAGPVDHDVAVTLWPSEYNRARKRAFRRHSNLKQGWTFRPASTEDSKKIVDRVIGKDVEKISINKDTLKSAEDLVAKAQDSMNNLRQNLREYEEHYWSNGGAKIPETIMGGTPDPSFVEASSQATAEAGAGNIPAANPDMVPIPPKIHDIIEKYYGPQAQMMYRPVPVTMVKNLANFGGNAAFNTSAGFWSPGVGPSAEVKADYLLTRAANVDRLELGHRKLWMANNETISAGEELHKFRVEANKPMPEHKTHGIVDADLKPKMILDTVNGTVVAKFVTPTMRPSL